MDDVFIRELVIFLGVCGLFIGTVPVLLRGHKVAPIEETLNGSGAALASDADGAAAGAVNNGAQQVRVSKKRRARARASNRKSR